MIPIPGTSVLIDISILIEETMHYIHQLKLSKNSISIMAESFGLTYKQVEKNVIEKNNFFHSIISIELGGLTASVVKESAKVITEVVFQKLSELLTNFLAQYIAANTVEEFVKVFLPGIGSVVGAAMSFGTTCLSLRKVLDNFEETSKKILEYCKQNRKK